MKFTVPFLRKTFAEFFSIVHYCRFKNVRCKLIVWIIPEGDTRQLYGLTGGQSRVDGRTWLIWNWEPINPYIELEVFEYR